MAPPRNVVRAMFDIKPVTQSGDLDLEKIERAEPTISLRSSAGSEAIPLRIKKVAESRPLKEKVVGRKTPKNPQPHRETIADFENSLQNLVDIRAELARVGGEIVSSSSTRIRPRAIIKPNQPLPIGEYEPPDNLPIAELAFHKSHLNNPEGELLETKMAGLDPEQEDRVTNFMTRRAELESPAAREVNRALEQIKKEQPYFKSKNKVSSEKTVTRGKNKNWPRRALAGGIITLLAGFGFFRVAEVKNSILAEGNSAVINLERAQANLANLDFLSAASSFALAAENFNQASKKLNLIGASFASIFSDVPGLSQVGSAQNLIFAGQNIAQAGESLATAFSELSETNFVAHLGVQGRAQRPLSEYIGGVRGSLIFAQDQINKSASLLASVDPAVLPEEKRDLFLEFNGKMPQFQEFVSAAVDYTDFLLDFVGTSKRQRYLVLFQNNSELRPTGGFPGSYALLDFNEGRLKELLVDDIYNPDGQIKDNIIPPKQLQHITPTWGIRDANWFADFRISAKKVTEFYEKVDGVKVDGVLSLTPTVVGRILEIVGPIEMKDYGVTLNAENFLPLIQEEVEYGDGHEINQPKRIVIDFVPIFLERLALQDKKTWVKIFETILVGMQEKHVLAYFSDSKMQEVAERNNFSGQVLSTKGDFLLVTHSNIKGSKTDAVTQSALSLKTKIAENGFVEHTLEITRVHEGGKTSFGFYNRQNPDFVRVLTPPGSELLEIEGQSQVSPQAIVDYTQDDFKADPDLAAYEETMKTSRGVTNFQESGKQGFGFWLVTNPGQTKTVRFRYLTPIRAEGVYTLLVQKQSGTEGDKFEFEFEPPKEAQVIFRTPSEIQGLNGNLVLDTTLKTDQNIKVQWR
ncbi:MAG: hypothetical protein COV31_02110 [Candidatus Yanofskybacteria bacterium CG10_big_fil_rev_8_21_14_0_10_46_23]|uniref:DUF4012 domain-containing protein n=1 Tax=Candidatus Yanofskybacteria bacterium CG10_big_fil_rev_8_21_14_0_10_46_23 TaxID=1975098 RepID=A0A2H0R3S3_9BACT|nr:MAG: hypothetical protein COV31_02110 [Candidatus Yanofskybacteria bacterium CG10_big_fil_rev_8_21_14_0_10_46_23]